jgi:hypothetical protein
MVVHDWSTATREIATTVPVRRIFINGENDFPNVVKKKQ